MPARTTEAHRALEQLEAFHASLTRPADADLRYAIERIIGIFKANLFQALLDIQEFYDNTLLNERVPLDLKTLETKKLAERWEQHPPFGTRYTPSLAAERPVFPATYAASTGTGLGGVPYTNGIGSGGAADATKTTTSTSSQHTYSYHEQSRQLTKDGWQTSEYKTATVDGPGGYQTETVSNSGLIDDSGKEWEVEDVVLEKNQFGLGFSIAGGKDHKTTGPYIRVTDISPGGAVARDGRIRIGDVILKVNTTDTVDVPHQVAVDALKSSGSVVRLLVKRLKPPLATAETFRSASVEPLSRLSPSGISPPVPGHQSHVTEAIRDLEQRPGVRRMELIKMLSADGRSKGLGFSIAGGVGNQHYPGDDGIFVTRIIDGSPAFFDGRLQKGDQILAVDNVIFNGVTHQFAVNTLKNTGERVGLLYLKNPHPDLEAVNRQLEESDRSRSLQAFDTTGGADLHSIGGGSHSHLAYGAAPHPVSVEIPLEPRLVRLRKGDNGLGFNIVGGEDGEPIYVSHILPGGAANLSGNVRTGDVLLRVNDVNLQNANHAQAAVALKAVPLYSEVQLLLQYRPLEYQVFDQKMSQVRAQMAQQVQQQQQFNVAAVPQPQQQIVPTKQDFYVRALFDNDPSRDAGVPHRSLAFRYGEILHIVNVADDDWWTARKVAENGDEGIEGIVPSRKRVEKRERQRRKQVNFNAGSQSLGRNASMGGGGGGFGGGGGGGSGMEGRRGSRNQLSFSRRFPFVKSTEKLNEYASDGAEKRYRRLREKAQQQQQQQNASASSPSPSKEFQNHHHQRSAAVSDSETAAATSSNHHRSHSKQRHSQQFNYSPIAEEPIHSYETVDLQQINYVRPVIILGALKDRINDELVTRDPDRFSSCVPHTSRPPRESEVQGRDYYFVSKPEMDRDIKNNLFIEAGQFQNNLYGTSIASVQEVANSGRHCILDVSGNAIRRLQNTARIFPISIFIKPFSHHQLLEWDSQLTEEDALRQFERCQRQEQSFGDLFTTIVSGHSMEDIFARVMHTINEQSRRDIWVPTHEPLP